MGAGNFGEALSEGGAPTGLEAALADGAGGRRVAVYAEGAGDVA